MGKKVLIKKYATSILCEKKLLDQSQRLEIVGENKDNVYYWIKGSNSVIMHVEDDFCILVDYMVEVYNQTNKCSLPNLLEKKHYTVQQIRGRDWIKSSSNKIGYDIKSIIHGIVTRPPNMTLDHLAETYDEREKNKEFSKNINHGSHRVIKVIGTMKQLDELIDRVIYSEKKKAGIGPYFSLDVLENKRRKRNERYKKHR